MSYNLNQYSPLSQINKSNIKRLVPIWSRSLSNDAGELAQRAIYNGVMYVVNGHWTFALDVATGQQIWRTPFEYENQAKRAMPAGEVTSAMPGTANCQNG
jgi:alcohol dehydrogenase (cytochrome c)